MKVSLFETAVGTSKTAILQGQFWYPAAERKPTADRAGQN